MKPSFSQLSSMPLWYRHLRRWAGALTLAAVSCAKPQTRDDTAQNVRSELRLVAWNRADSLVFQRLDMRGQDDASEVTCDNRGLYAANQHGKVALFGVDTLPCELFRANTGLSLAPDGRTLIYADQNRGGRIHRFDILTTHDTILAQNCLPNQGAPSWSPDGSEIAFARGCADPEELAYLHLMRRDGSNVKQVGAPRDSMTEEDPSWSPERGRIAIARGLPVSKSKIAIADIASGSGNVIADGYAPAWAPNGVWIAYAHLDSTQASQPSIWLVRPNGSDNHVIVDAARLGGSASAAPPGIKTPFLWSRDGAHLAFVSDNVIWVVDVTGDDLNRLVMIGEWSEPVRH